MGRAQGNSKCRHANVRAAGALKLGIHNRYAYSGKQFLHTWPRHILHKTRRGGERGSRIKRGGQ